jgi:hypothetical protein
MSGGRVMALVLAVLGTACSVIVAQSLSATDGYPSKGSPGSSGSTSQDPCSLLAGSQLDASPCADCITANCNDDVVYACNNDGGQPKGWFSDLQRCAQGPDVAYGASAGFWGCATYAVDAASLTDPTGPTEGAKQSKSVRCVETNCVEVDNAACRTCPIYITDKGGERLPLQSAVPCGKCLHDNCAKVLAQCCDQPVVAEHVKHCANPSLPEDNTACLALWDDAGSPPPATANPDTVCDYQVRICFQNQCKSSCH